MSIDQAIEHQYYTLGIAGHIDHGKTTLTKALTGKETDRLKEEQERQISIELGFASFPLSNGKLVGVIDVPGHERFIRQMVAGVAGIDMVLMVIAADEGIMPQTREHLDILTLLGVERGILVLTKVDTVDAEFLDLVKDSILEETKDTFLKDSPIIEVDSLSGKGISELKLEIENLMATVPAHPTQGITRLPIDRVFSKKGFGTVVTGTLYQGKMTVGEELQLLPQETKVKVRNIQVHDQPVQSAYAGQRVAVNISDVRVEDIKRGDVLVTKGTIKPTDRVDIDFHLLDDLDFSLKQRSQVRVHIGTSEVLAKLIFFDRNECQPGESCFAQLEISEPITCLFEDRFVLRRPTPMTTVGGGMIIDPYAKKHRFGPATVDMISAKKEGDLAARANQLINKEGIISTAQLIHQLGVSQQEWEAETATLTEKGIKHIYGDSTQSVQQTLVTTVSIWEQTWQDVISELEQYHKRYPLREGIDRLQVQKKYFEQLSTTQWNMVLREAQKEAKVKVKNESISAAQFDPQLRDKDQQIWQDIQLKMKQNPIEVPIWGELLPAQMSNELQHDLQRLLLRQGKLVQIEEQRFLDKSIYEELIQQLKSHTPHTFSVQDVREVVQTSRKYMIPFLESLDRNGYTVRKDNERTWKQ